MNPKELVHYDEIAQIDGSNTADFLLQTAERLDAPSLIVLHKPSDDIIAVIDTYRRELSRVVKGHTTEENEKIDDFDIEEILWMAHYSGILSNTNNIHIHDLAGADGRTALLSAFARRQEGGLSDDTSVSVYDTNGKFWECQNLARKLGIDAKSFDFTEGDVAKIPLTSRTSRDNYWVARRPELMTAAILKRLAECDPQVLPISAVVLPSEWYGYSENEPVIESIVDNVTWRKLFQLRDKFQLNLFEVLSGKRSTPESKLMIRVTERVMNCLRVAGINTATPRIKGKIQELPNGRDLLTMEYHQAKD